MDVNKIMRSLKPEIGNRNEERGLPAFGPAPPKAGKLLTFLTPCDLKIVHILIPLYLLVVISILIPNSYFLI